MARKIRDSRLESRTARCACRSGKSPTTGPLRSHAEFIFFTAEIRVMGRGGQGPRMDVVVTGPKAFKVADDLEDADGIHVLAFYQACDEARALARGKVGATDGKPMTVADALTATSATLKSRGGHLTNATRVEKHLTSTLAGKPVGLLTVRDLQSWRDGLIEKMEAVERQPNPHRIACGLRIGATLDHRITKPARVSAGPSRPCRARTRLGA